jgi:aminoglycoside phosphotransferase (APT) family kinase protein
MSTLDILPGERRDVARDALQAAFAGATTAITPVTGGASGALTYRVEAHGRPYLLRLEGARRSPLRNPHQYTCMQIASEAGVAPGLHYVDAEAGVAIMDFLPVHPLEEFPGGRVALARAAGQLVARLQATVPFPQFIDYFDALDRMLRYLRSTKLFAPGLLDPHAEGFGRIRAALPKSTRQVSAHNDPNPRNMLFDGERLWLVDWETAYRNDPLVDVAILLDQLECTPEMEQAVLAGWSGGAPDASQCARLTLIRAATRLYYAGLMLMPFAAVPRERPDGDLSAPTPAAFRRDVEEGRLAAASPETLFVLGKMQLAGFLAALAAPGFEEALARAADGEPRSG